MPHADKIYYHTTTLCPLCEKLLPGVVQSRNGGVFVSRVCPDHGTLDALVCSDIAWYESLPKFDVAPEKPSNPRAKTVKGCPDDCGLCPAHRQKAGTAAIEISNRCNNDCPVCLADNQATFEMSPQQVLEIVESALQSQSTVDVVTLSGGEPTIHPQLFEILDLLSARKEVGRISINTNGIRVAQDDAFLQRLQGYSKVYVSLHYDGQGAKALRNTEFAMQQRALDRLCDRGISVVPVVLGAQGVNEKELGSITLGLLTRSVSVKSAILSLMAYTGSGGSRFEGDPKTRLTIPGALDEIELGTNGVLRKSDFMPLPMPNPICAAIGYFLVDGPTVTPLIRCAGVDRVLDFTKNSHFASVDDRLEDFFRDSIDRVFAEGAAIEDGELILPRLKAFITRLFPKETKLDNAERARIVEESIKTVFVMQFMDGWTFDSLRLQKCSCQHLLPDGVRVPSCGYYAYHRRFDGRFSRSTHG